MDRQRYRLSSDRYDWEAVRRLNDQSAIRNSDNPLVAALVIVFVRALL